MREWWKNHTHNCIHHHGLRMSNAKIKIRSAWEITFVLQGTCRIMQYTQKQQTLSFDIILASASSDAEF